MSPGTLMAALPKPFDQMTLTELQRERAHWQRYVDDPTNTGVSVGVARDFVLMFDALIARRAPAAHGVAA